MAETKTIRSIAYDQHEILYNIMQLYTDGQPFECDPTYSIGNFYGDFTVTTIEGDKMDISIPQPKYKFDVAPQVEGVVQIDPWGPIPLEDNSVSSVCIDLPFVISCGPSMQGPNFDENGKRVKNNMISQGSPRTTPSPNCSNPTVIGLKRHIEYSSRTGYSLSSVRRQSRGARP